MQMLERAEEMDFSCPFENNSWLFWELDPESKWALGRKDVTADELLGNAILITE